MDLFYVFVFAILSSLCHAALWTPARKGADFLALLYLMFLVYLSLSHMVSRVRCGNCLYRIQNSASFPT